MTTDLDRRPDIAAPVCPAVTIASARSLRTRSHATVIDASRFSRSASAGCSSISMTWLAGTISTLAGRLGATAAIRAGSPTRKR